jgi:hypothetical protein
MAYKAFISYSHAADGKLAPAVQSALHQFTKPWYSLRAIRVFRDETNLSANPDLWGSIEKALSESEYFILMSSPEAAASKWVKKEIDYWLKNKSADKVLIIQTDGIIEWDDAAGDFDWKKTTGVPENLKKAFARVPKYVDLSWARKQEHLSRRQSAFQGAIALLAATLHDMPLDEIAGEDVRQHRRTVRITWFAAVALVILTTSSVIAALKAIQNQRIAGKNQRVALARQLAAQSQATLGSFPQRSLLLALEALATTKRAGEARVSIAEEVLRQALAEAGGRSLSGHEGFIPAVAISPDNHWLVTGSEDKTARLWNLRLDGLVELACRTAGRNLSADEWKQYMGEEPYHKTCPKLPVHPSVAEPARDTARQGDIKTAAAEFKEILEIESSLVLKPEEEAKQVYAAYVLEEGKILQGRER